MCTDVSKAGYSRKIVEVILGGASPCQSNSYLNQLRQGLGDVRPSQPDQIGRISDDCNQHVWKTVRFLEDTVSDPRDILEYHDDLLQCNSLRVSASVCDYVQTDRRVWPSHEIQSICNTNLIFPQDWQAISSENATKTTSVKYMKKAISRKSAFRGRIWPTVLNRYVLKESKRGAIYTFTRCSPHPRDLEHRACIPAVARYRYNMQRYQPSAYTQDSLA
jgi:hypothetical protein